jgi:hypothetical protein
MYLPADAPGLMAVTYMDDITQECLSPVDTPGFHVIWLLIV